ncbi:MAG: peptidoglycan DD-metalloendopeptidase family protein [Syntrophobacteraceae bacterium]
MKKLVVKTLPGRPNHRVGRNLKFRGRHLFILLLAAGVVFIAYKKFFPRIAGTPEKVLVFAPASPPAAEVPPLDAPAPAKRQETSEKFEIRHKMVSAGDSIAKVLESFQIPNAYITQWERACKSALFSQLRAGDELIFFLDRSNGQPIKIFYSTSGGPVHALRNTSDGWECLSQEAVPKVPVKTVHARYAENFYDSCIAGGLPAILVSSLADIFAYDIDFTTDFKDGDTFTVFFQEQEIEGKESKQYLILAAEMVMSGKTFQAFGFLLPDGDWEYFDAKGASLKRAFLKSPLSFRRLIAPSSYKNVKPVLKIYRPHLGIDYAAPKGTPVSAIGDGVVTAVNKKGKAAVSIEIRHRGGFKSLYGHLSGYSRGLYRGGIVSQGEMIGSVGSGAGGKTYLDFHFFKNGKAVNFHKIDFLRSTSVPKSARAEFEKTRDSYLAALKGKAPQRLETPSGRQ